MKKSIIFFLTLVLIISSVSSAMAQEITDPAEEAAPRDEAWGQTVPADRTDDAGRWWTWVSIQLGAKELDSDWQEPNHSSLKVSITLPTGAYKDPRKNWPPYFVSFDYAISREHDALGVENTIPRRSILV